MVQSYFNYALNENHQNFLYIHSESAEIKQMEKREGYNCNPSIV